MNCADEEVKTSVPLNFAAVTEQLFAADVLFFFKLSKDLCMMLPEKRMDINSMNETMLFKKAHVFYYNI